MNTIRIALADDHPIVLAGLRMLITAEHDLDVVGEATTGPQALELIRATQPDIAIIDISLPEMSGILLARQLAEHCPDVRVIILTQHEGRAYLRQALEAGAKGYVLKKSAARCLVNAIRGVWVGGLYVDPPMAAHVFLESRKPSPPNATNGMRHLTGRESEVLKLLAMGLTAKEVAGHLGLSLSSIETYKTRAVGKAGLNTRAEIVRYASAQGWLTSI
jgi:DNA-binding NarL/FixJ family response regulator